jgi:hypothetical protein
VQSKLKHIWSQLSKPLDIDISAQMLRSFSKSFLLVFTHFKPLLVKFNNFPSSNSCFLSTGYSFWTNIDLRSSWFSIRKTVWFGTSNMSALNQGPVQFGLELIKFSSIRFFWTVFWVYFGSFQFSTVNWTANKPNKYNPCFLHGLISVQTPNCRGFGFVMSNIMELRKVPSTLEGVLCHYFF